MQQCPSCQHELTMKEQVENPDQCPSCGIYFAKFLAKQSALKDAALSEQGRSGGFAGAKSAVRESRSKREAEERYKAGAKNRPSPVTVVDFDLPFWALVQFLVKLTFAAIPAAIIVWILIAGAASVVAVIDMILS